jgi:general secretion pathway protein H
MQVSGIAIRHLHGSERTGFTLLELLVVLIIVSIAAVVVGIRIGGGMSTVQLRTAAKKVSAALRYARSEAASAEVRYVADFDFENNQMGIYPDERASTSQEGREVYDPEREEGEGMGGVRTYRLPDGVMLEKCIRGEDEFDSGSFEILFLPTGSSTGGEVLLSIEGGLRYRILVDLITGAVELKEEVAG